MKCVGSKEPQVSRASQELAEADAAAAKLAALKDRIKTVFKRWDRDGNGVMSRPEITRLLRGIGSTSSDVEIVKVFDEIDTNGNNQVDMEEFVEWVMQPGSCVQVGDDAYAGDFNLAMVLKPLFQVYDRKKNGTIDLEEFKELHSILQGAISAHEYEMKEATFAEEIGVFEDVERVFEEADVDNDKLISLEEFIDWQREAVQQSAISKHRFIELVGKLSALLQGICTVEDALGPRPEDEKPNAAKVRADFQKVCVPMQKQIALITQELYAGDDARKDRSVWEALPAHICKQTLLRVHMKTPVPTYNVLKIDFVIQACVPALEHRRRLGHHRPWLAKVTRKIEYSLAKQVPKRHAGKKKTKSADMGHRPSVVTRLTAAPDSPQAKARHMTETEEELSPQAKARHMTETEEELAPEEGNVVHSDHFYRYDENADGILMWLPAVVRAAGEEYDEALEALSAELHILAMLITEVDFGKVCTWTSLESVMQSAIDLGLLNAEHFQKIKGLLERFAMHMISKGYPGAIRLSAEMRQKLVDHFLASDFKCTPFEVMLMLTDAEIVRRHSVWQDEENADWKEFKSLNPTHFPEEALSEATRRQSMRPSATAATVTAEEAKAS